MSLDILATYQRIIQTQVPLQETLLEHHFKATALVEVLLASDLYVHSMPTLHNFLWVVSDLLKQAQTLNQELLDMLLKAAILSDPSPGTSGGSMLH